MAKFKRILLKLSGESLDGQAELRHRPERLSDYAKQIKEVHEMGVQIGIVIGGGNIFRGLSGSQKGFDRVKGDQMGMCATVINLSPEQCPRCAGREEQGAYSYPHGAYR